MTKIVQYVRIIEQISYLITFGGVQNFLHTIPFQYSEKIEFVPQKFLQWSAGLDNLMPCSSLWLQAIFDAYIIENHPDIGTSAQSKTDPKLKELIEVVRKSKG